ncbi:MAG: hypothetical protein UU42_C0006G0016 [Candidatus Woesebacteria bacterium GW2011_GWA1_41_13b]|uniref:Uncharacterized protein n=1 Tax=Candidatus Woesebacteria bacterium GW2011_GWA1_41_13b TaxID=1618555 RepID=A0A0G0XVK8_9BACT|nr:MAG: hypothetical protein UU42_C0006G0016 [Candidatus Woesebacteria bacterium GW2011_GWA1_41_13b]
MAPLDYKTSLARYRRYLATVQEQPLLRASLYLVLSLLLIIILILAALRPTLITIASLSGDIKQQGEIEKKLDAKITQVSQAQQILSANETKLLVLNQALPIGEEFSIWGKRMEELAQESGVTLTGVALENYQDFALTVQGNYIQLKSFLNRVESLRRLMKIESVQIVSSANLTMIIKGKLESYEEK